MTGRRIAIWCRLLLAAAVLALPAASAVASTSTAHGAARHHHATADAHAATSVASLTPTPGLHRTRHVHRTAPMVAAVATTGVALVVLLVGSGVARRRASQLVGVVRHWWSSRAPPSGTGLFVPFGHPSGGAGCLSRSPRALFSRTIPVHC